MKYVIVDDKENVSNLSLKTIQKNIKSIKEIMTAIL
jgi:hypothetical protein